MNKPIRTIFIGTPDFGVPALQSLVNSANFEIIGVITQPDKKIGRKQVLTSPPIKVTALEHKIAVHQPEKIRNFSLDVFSDIDLIVVVAYAQIIPKSILESPKYGCINIHGSLLPKYRGAACIQASIMGGDPETGITIMQMDEGLDTGAIIHQEKIKIENNDTTGVIFDKLSTLGGHILPDILLKYISGDLKPQAQDNNKSSYVGMLKKTDGHIDWNKTAVELERFVRAMSPWPGASAITNYKLKTINLKIISTEHSVLEINSHTPGTLFINDDKLCVQCGQDALIVKQLQLEGKKALTDKEFLNGHQNLIGTTLE
ncbi:methionyl-tRNA formyltransferase [Candidatus Parcubacteria bacterium]|nr:methionyl-tRNA formyltransferase [Patescibacteria group bacterium]MBU4309235.1 methionyl-tRNA formyltransferase [Patescibacteria group bacterium]MBU4432321.1 methionyl-tRNA formyltransferase [Patescibacteria group bacterium]MBU4577596.1 methionyl-tRNA formyltransferase [Patescibacteria group bacterium]MCG2697283.1 methionyl-tRNA formyltransferase [Candidatus Parcubacteria bacterium]